MAAATTDRDGQRQLSELVPYFGASGRNYYKGTFVMVNGPGVIIPAVAGAGASGGYLLGVAANRVTQNSTGTSSATLHVWKTGEFYFDINGTGASADIGRRAYIVDDQTVGTSVGFPAHYAGEIVGFKSTSSQYRVRIDSAINVPYIAGLSGFNYLN